MFSSISNRLSGLFRIKEENMEDHPFGKPITIHSIPKNDGIINDFAAIEKLLNHPDVKNRKIVVFSIIGAYRRGKSFFLNYCLRFLYANYKSINYPDNPCDNSNWMGHNDEPLIGFDWKSGVERVTSGIVIWSDIFLHTNDISGQKLAIVVMDTQGLFDNLTSPAQNARIFSLSTLISSIQILNLSNLIQEDQLQYLQFAIEFAKYAGSDCNGRAKPFQNLLILIRDWSNCDQFEYGIKGGQDYLRHILKIQADQMTELACVRQFIYDSFDKVGCALLPHPGKSITGGKRKKDAVFEYDGRWSEMDEDFKEEIEFLIENLLAPNNLVVKNINGIAVKSSDFKKYMMNYFTLFASDELPQTQSIYESTIENHMNLLVQNCLQTYKSHIYRNEDLITNTTMIYIVHDISRKEALLDFNDARKMGNSEHEMKFKKVLVEKIDDLYQLWSENSEKNLDKLEEEKKKLQLANEEQQRLEKEQVESSRKAAERLAELEAENTKNLKQAYEELQKVRIEAENGLTEMEDKYAQDSVNEEIKAQQLDEINKKMKEMEEKYKMKKEIAELRLKAEQSELSRIQAVRKREEVIKKEILNQRNLAIKKKEIENCMIL